MDRLEQIPLNQIYNPNKLKDRTISEIEESEAFLDFLFSIKTVGLLQPICLIEREEKKYELLIGKRRFLAYSTLHELEPENEKYFAIPAIILNEISENDFPEELKILHENKFRQDILNSSYIESALSLLPRFISKDFDVDLVKGVQYIDEYFKIIKEKQTNRNVNIASFINSVDLFFELTKINAVEFEKYQILSKFDEKIKNLFYSNALYLVDIYSLKEIRKTNKNNYQACLEKLDVKSSKEDNKKVIQFFKQKEEGNINLNETLLFLKKKMRSIVRNSKEINSLEKKDKQKVKELFLEIEIIFKNAKGMKK